MIWVVLGFLALLGLVAWGSWYFSADQTARRAMRAVPVRAVAEVAGGTKARIVGRVRVDAPITAPLTGRACARWRVIVQEKRGGKNKHWVTVLDASQGVDFVVEDPSGKAIVAGPSVQAVLEQDGNFSSGFLNDATPELEAFLAAHGRSSQGFVFNKTMRYREGVVEPGETVTVVGWARWEADPEASARAGAGYRDAETPKRLVIDAPPGEALIVSDHHDMTR